jgi:hypothetical protein
MSHPARFAHLATRAVVVAKLMPTYALAHEIDEEEAAQRLDAALAGALLPSLLSSAWSSIKGSTKRLDEAGLLEKVAGTLRDRPLRPGRTATLNPAWSAFLVLADLHAGTASDAARKVLETEQGQKLVDAGLAEVGRYLGAELTRGA